MEYGEIFAIKSSTSIELGETASAVNLFHVIFDSKFSETLVMEHTSLCRTSHRTNKGNDNRKNKLVEE